MIMKVNKNTKLQPISKLRHCCLKKIMKSKKLLSKIHLLVNHQKSYAKVMIMTQNTRLQFIRKLNFLFSFYLENDLKYEITHTQPQFSLTKSNENDPKYELQFITKLNFCFLSFSKMTKSKQSQFLLANAIEKVAFFSFRNPESFITFSLPLSDSRRLTCFSSCPFVWRS